jgi:glycosyltransferase involved in cell wall biosynthesis
MTLIDRYARNTPHGKKAINGSEKIGTSPRRIGFVLSSLHFGGAERVALNLASALKSEGYDVQFVLMDASGEFLSRAEADFSVVDLRCDRTWKLPGKLALYLLRQRPVAVLSSFWKLNICLATARIVSPSTAIGLWEHSSPQVEGNSPTWLFAPSATILYRLATCVITVSHTVADDIAQRTLGLRSRIVTIDNAIPPPKITAMPFGANTPNGTRELVWVGRLAEVKNPGLMIAAFAQLPERALGYRLRLIGEGALRPELERQAERLGVADRVIFTGFLSDPYPAVATAHLLVISSVTEGLPTVAIEAMYLGINVVSTDCGSGIRDIVANGRLGSIVPNHDPAALAKSIAERLDKPITATELRRNACRYEPGVVASRVLHALKLRDARIDVPDRD